MEGELLTVKTAVDNTLNGLLGIARDYAYWDDMYSVVNSQDQEWLKANVADWIPKNFRIDLISIFDADKKLIYQYGNFDEFQAGKDLSDRPLMEKIFNSRETKGFYLTSKGMLYIVSSQIMHTDESGPRNGTYLYGRFVNLEELKAISRMDLSILTEKEVISSTFTGPISRPQNIENIYAELSKRKLHQVNIYKPDYQFAFIYTPLTDIKDNKIGMVELIRPRKSTMLFREFFIKVSFWVLISIVLTTLATILTITGFFLKPLEVLDKAIRDIYKTKDMGLRVTINSEDEIGVLARDFNTMLGELEESRSQLVKSQQDLVSLEKMATATELAIGMVHQINNPLSIVTGRVQLLNKVLGYKANIPISDLEKDLKIIDEQTRRAIDIVNNLLHYAVPLALRFEKCDINELLKEVIAPVKGLLEAENINIVERLKKDLPILQYCDRRQANDLFMNIIINAEQAMPGGGTLEIATDYDEENDLVCIKFTDNGHGISPENIKKLFTPFFSTKADRCGLGLATSYNIAKGHGGTVEVESKVGVGSTFTVKLPAGKAKDAT